MSEPSPTDFVVHEDTVDLPSPAHVRDVLYAVELILRKPIVTDIRIRPKKPIQVTWYGPPQDTLDFDLPTRDPSEFVRDVEEIIEPSPDMHPDAQLGWSVRNLERRGLVVTHAIVGRTTLLWKWLGVDLSTIDVVLPRYVAGGFLLPSEAYPPYQLLLVACPSRLSDISEATAAARICMTVKA